MEELWKLRVCEHIVKCMLLTSCNLEMHFFLCPSTSRDSVLLNVMLLPLPSVFSKHGLEHGRSMKKVRLRESIKCSICIGIDTLNRQCDTRQQGSCAKASLNEKFSVDDCLTSHPVINQSAADYLASCCQSICVLCASNDFHVVTCNIHCLKADRGDSYGFISLALQVA